MNDQMASALRSALKVAGGALVAKGLTDQSGLEVLVSAAVTLIGLVWSWWTHRDNKNEKTTEANEGNKE